MSAVGIMRNCQKPANTRHMKSTPLAAIQKWLLNYQRPKNPLPANVSLYVNAPRRRVENSK